METQQINGAVLNLLFAKKTIDAASPISYIEAMANNKTNQTTLTHKHHIIPRHFGGMDYAWNIAELTLEEHADAHRRLYEAFGKLEDKWALNFLTWQATKDPEAYREARRINSKKGYEASWGKWTKAERSARAKKANEAARAKRDKVEWSASGKKGGKASAAMKSKEELYALGKKVGTIYGKMTKGKLYYNNGVRNIRRFEGTEPDGYVRGRMWVSNKGKVWYNNGEKNIMCYEGTQPEGFVRGVLAGTRAKGRVWYNDGRISKQCFPGTEPDGFVRGQLPVGKLWYNNGVRNTKCFPGTEPDGFVRGLLPTARGADGRFIKKTKLKRRRK